MRNTHRRWLTAAVAATGAGALALGTAALPAVGVESTPAETGIEATAAGAFVEPNSSGPDALSQMDSADLQTVASRAGLSADRLSAILEADEAIVTPGGAVVFHDDFEIHDHAMPDGVDVADVPGDPVNGSRPDAPHTFFIDFDGGVIENTEWNVAYDADRIEVSAYSVDDDFKHEVWAGVAQNYAPFNVNVTIVDPGADALNKTSADDNEYGTRLLIVPEEDELPAGMQGVGGRAMLGWFGVENGDPGGYVIAGNVGHRAQSLASVLSHEAGHNFGLMHHGIGDDEYYYFPTPASPEALWGPIMGAPYSAPVISWSVGDYADATSPDQDDLAIVTDRGAAHGFVIIFDQDGSRYTDAYCTYRDGDLVQGGEHQPGDEFFTPGSDGLCAWEKGDHTGTELVGQWNHADRTDPAPDTHGDSTSDATALDNSEGSFTEDGTIIERDDVDVFSFVTEGGPFTAEVTPANERAGLDLKLSLLDVDGNVITEDEQETTVDPTGYPNNPRAIGLDASLTDDLEMGVYYLQVEGRGQGDPMQNTPENGSGYSDYGSLGFYELSGTAEPFEADDVVITSPEDGAEVEAADLEVAGTAEAEASVTLTVGGETVGTADVDTEGAWNATLEDALAPGETTITAQQTVETITVPQTASVTVIVPDDEGTEDGTDDGSEDGDDNGTDSGTDNGAEDGTDDGTDDGTEDGGDKGDENGTDGGTDNGGDENGTDSGTEDGDELPDTGAGNLIGLAAGLGLLAVGGVLYTRTRRATV